VLRIYPVADRRELTRLGQACEDRVGSRIQDNARLQRWCKTVGPVVAQPKYRPLRVTEAYVTRLEGWCDEFNARLGKLDSFILPGGTPGAALLHVARTVARRAERSAWALADADPHGTNPLALTYLNRLSDLLFILSRVANPGGDVLWKPGGDR